MGTISGNIVNLQGHTMTTACVVAYLPNQYTLFAPVSPDGSYLITGVPSGTYAVAALGCNGGDPNPVVSDPDSPSINYTALWWNNIPLTFDQTNQGGPDPIAQGATMVTVTPGEQVTDHNFCFGCTAIAIAAVTPGSASLTVAFTTPGLVSPDRAASADDPQTDPLAYSATCTSSTGGVAGTGTASGAGTGTITVTGLTAGATYTCQVTATNEGVPVAASAPSDTLTLAGGDPAVTPAAIPAMLAFTGSTNVTATAVVGIVLVLLGLATLGGSRKLRHA